MPVCWTIAGSDSSGGAGIQADLKTFNGLGVYGCSIITASTAQNTLGVQAILPTPLDHLGAQWSALHGDLPPAALKIGMVGSEATLNWLLDELPTVNACKVFDPVMVSTTGAPLSTDPVLHSKLKALLPLVDVVTPNISEAELLLQRPINNRAAMAEAAGALLQLGAKAVLLKGGHLSDQNHTDGFCQDILATPGHTLWLTSPTIHTLHHHGTGCTLSAALTATMALGYPLQDAAVLAKAYVNQGLLMAPQLGSQPDSCGPLYHGGWPEVEALLPWLTSHYETGLNRPHCPPLDHRLFGVYPIVDRADRLPRLFEAGVELAQLRIKDLSGDALEDEVAQAIALGKHYKRLLFINDHWQLALKYQACGVHLGQDDLQAAEAQQAVAQLADAGIYLGISTHNVSEVAHALAYRPSYIAIGPIHPTTTKAMPHIPQGVNGFRRWRRTLASYPLVAIGGLFLDNATPLFEAGANAVAVVRDLAQSQDPATRVAAWQRLVGQLQQPDHQQGIAFTP
ncbi:MAG: bifunctional hydroxymethylpyrimidine kinase/phosphomethylpyrimidine kinase [Cyanobacteria bacterium HKST-UBA03]|nr:bifunctional hydroxymethylpyrimidine kinase/phosphomethylpyrimidine kinase [Cyanobacteria bacterium HKST-UBA03]